jgi:hypothetical protein
MPGIQVLAGSKDFSLLHRIQLVTTPTQPPTKLLEVISLEIKWPQHFK